MIKDLKDELGGAFEKLVLALMETPYEYLAHELNRAMKGVGTNESVITEVIFFTFFIRFWNERVIDEMAWFLDFVHSVKPGYSWDS